MLQGLKEGTARIVPTDNVLFCIIVDVEKVAPFVPVYTVEHAALKFTVEGFTVYAEQKAPVSFAFGDELAEAMTQTLIYVEAEVDA